MIAAGTLARGTPWPRSTTGWNTIRLAALGADRILLGDGDPAAIAVLAGWQRPRLRVGGGDLIAMGLEAGPVVARTLQAIEREWAEAGFPPEGAAQRAIARRHVDQALRERQ